MIYPVLQGKLIWLWLVNTNAIGGLCPHSSTSKASGTLSSIHFSEKRALGWIEYGEAQARPTSGQFGQCPIYTSSASILQVLTESLIHLQKALSYILNLNKDPA